MSRWRAIIIGACLALLPARPAHAQVLLGMLFGGKMATENFNIGLEIGMNLPTVDGLEDPSLGRGALFGLFASWRFSEHWHLMTALTPISGKGANDAMPIPLGDPELDAETSTGRMDRQLDYLDLPILLQLAQKRASGLRVGAGPQLSFLLSGEDRYAATSAQGTPFVLERDIEDALETVDAGVAFDAEYRFAKVPLAIGVRYYHGLTNIMRSDASPAMYNRVLSGSGRITLGSAKAKPQESR